MSRFAIPRIEKRKVDNYERGLLQGVVESGLRKKKKKKKTTYAKCTREETKIGLAALEYQRIV